MGGWRIDPQICDDIVRVFEANPQVQTKGMISMKGGGAPVIDKSVKDSIEMSFAPNDARPEWKAYLGALSKVTGGDNIHTHTQHKHACTWTCHMDMSHALVHAHVHVADCTTDALI